MTDTTEKISPQALVHTLTRIHALILAEEHILDDEGTLRELLRTLHIDLEENAADEAVLAALRREIQALKTLIYKDELTGALNRRGILDECEGFFREALFTKENRELRKGITITDFSILFFDLDDFKAVNDTHGHEAGDQVLRDFVAVLKKNARDIDAVGRLGGEEFIVGLLGASEDEAFEKAQHIRTQVLQSVRVGDTAITASIGVAALQSSHATTLSELIDRADKAMYEAKTKRGKNTVVRYSELPKA